MDTKTKPPRDFTDLWARPGHLIRRLHQIHVAMFLEDCREYNVTPVQFGVLTVLYDGQERDQISIAERLAVDRNTVADVVRRLEGRGLLIRPASVEDKRSKLARITDQGRTFVDAVQPLMIKAQRRFTEPLNREEYDTLMNLLAKLAHENNELSRAPLRPNSKRSGTRRIRKKPKP